MPTPPRRTVARRPANGDHAKPIFGCATTAVTEGKAVCCPVTIALFTGAFTSIVPSGPARCWKQLVWQTGLDRCSRRTLSVSFRLLLTRMSSDAYAPNWYSAIGCSSFCGKFCTIRLPGPPVPPVANASRDRGRTSGVTKTKFWSVMSSLRKFAPTRKVCRPRTQLKSSTNWYCVMRRP